MSMEKNYNPQEAEDEIYKAWEEGGYFEAKSDSNKKPFTVVMPPPNITGNLHMGHACFDCNRGKNRGANEKRGNFQKRHWAR